MLTARNRDNHLPPMIAYHFAVELSFFCFCFCFAAVDVVDVVVVNVTDK